MKVKNYWNIENSSSPEEQVRDTTRALKEYYDALNNGITIKDNLKGAILNVTFVSANTDTQVRHGLDFAPSNYICCGKDSSFHIYDGTKGSDKVFFYLRASATGSARIFIF